MGIQRPAHENERLPSETRLFDLACDVGHRALEDAFVRPCRTVNDRRRSIRGQAPLSHENSHQIVNLSGTEEEDQRRSGPCEGRRVFALGHGSAPGGAGEHDALAHVGTGEFAAESRRRAEDAAHAGDDARSDAFFGKSADLLIDRAVHGRISGVQADDALSGEGGFAHGGDLLPKVHGGAVPAFAVGLAALEVPGIDQRPGVHHEVGLFQRTQAAQGDEVFRARSGADEFDERSVHDVISFWNVNR